MSKYTTQLRWIVEQTLKDKELEWEDEDNWSEVYTVIGLDDYPIFDELYREELNNKIMRHYMFREIGMETVALFRWMLRRTMFEVMPYFNQLYESQWIIEHPLRDFEHHHIGSDDKSVLAHTDENVMQDNVNKQDTVETGETEHIGSDVTVLDRTGKDTDVQRKTGADVTTTDETGKTVNDLESDVTTNNRNVFQDTPMSLLDNTTSPTVAGLDYATNVTYDDGTTHTESTDTTNRDTNVETTAEYGSVLTTDMQKATKDTTTYARGTSDLTSGDSSTLTRDNLNRDMARMYSDKENSNDEYDDWGYNSSQSKLLLEYRKTFINIDMQVIEALSDCFMKVW